MRLHLIPAALAILASAIGCASGDPVFVAANSPEILYMGRLHWGDSLAPEFTYPGTSAQLNFKGTSLAMAASPGSGKFMVEIDGGEPRKVVFTPGDSLITLADSLTDAPHTALITYAQEGYEVHPAFRGFYLSAGGKLLDPPARPELKIEFIGNSITCGYGTEETDPKKGFSYDTENHTLSYAYLTRRALDADVNVVARSGIGIYRNFGGDREGTDMTMPEEYDYTMLYRPEHLWDHTQFHPDIICINLGTNDTSLDNYDIDRFEKAYRDFVDHLLALHPKARIVMLTGPMLNGKALDDVRTSLDRIAADYGSESVVRFDLTPQDGSLGYGADYHPSAAQSRRAASELTAFLQSL